MNQTVLPQRNRTCSIVQWIYACALEMRLYTQVQNTVFWGCFLVVIGLLFFLPTLNILLWSEERKSSIESMYASKRVMLFCVTSVCLSSTRGLLFCLPCRWVLAWSMAGFTTSLWWNFCRGYAVFIVCSIIFSYSGLVLFVSISCHLPSDHMELSCYIFAAYFINDTHCYALFLVETIFLNIFMVTQNSYSIIT